MVSSGMWAEGGSWSMSRQASATSSGRSIASRIAAGGGIGRFDSSGVFDYHCSQHAGMTGTVIVQ